ncbi:helix-turn-helix transcriptional regulator [Aureisphaera galaxeae]|uniref:helix-turn-helix domain-containing protein n=1 Tax=Aureisphaera galaxeae TaxID=1538023 RepID=UPI00234FFBB7|nr:helix-turn-helix transcriptional regulator [Aureisphaera galaxeae]MDC8004547.1 helix-turn-helix transcriptional regulator [Aureisphaera galaxeae]
MLFAKIVDFILIAGVVQAFVFNSVTLFFRKKFSIVVLYLNLVVLFISLNNLQAWLINVGFTSDLFYIENLLVPWYFFILPMFYAFIIHFLEVDKKIIGFVKFSIVVFLIEFILRLGVITYVYYYVPGQDISYIEKYTAAEDIFNLALSLAIFYKAFELVFKRRDVYHQMLSYDDLNWLRLFFKIGGVVILFWIFAKVADFVFDIKWGYNILRLSSSILLYWIGYQGLYRYNVVQDRIQLRRHITKNQKFIGVGVAKLNDKGDMDKLRTDFNEINAFVIENKKYLDAELSLSNLASDLKLSTSHLSKVINVCSGQNFSDYINSLRVAQVKKLITDPSYRNYTMVAIGLECGFNSKSTFYSAFKKLTSKTPSQYLETIDD